MPPNHASGKRKPGRPKRGEEPNVPWNKVERVLVYGIRDGTQILWPKYHEVAAEHGVTPSRIAQFAVEMKIIERRRAIIAQLCLSLGIKSPEKQVVYLFDVGQGVLEREEETEEKTVDPIPVIEDREYINLFAQNFEEVDVIALTERSSEYSAQSKNLDNQVVTEKVSELYIFGVNTVCEESGEERRVWPGPHEIAGILQVQPPRVLSTIRRLGLRKRRSEFRDAVLQRTMEIEAEAVADTLAPRIRRDLGIISEFKDQFNEELEAGNVKVTNPVDYDRMVRLEHFIKGDPDQRTETNHTLTIESISERFVNVRRRGIDAEIPEDALSGIDVNPQIEDRLKDAVDADFAAVEDGQGIVENAEQ